MLVSPLTMTDTCTLPKTTEELQAIVKSVVTPYESQIEYLQQRIKVLEKIIFAPKSEKRRPDAVSYTHLDVYKRQILLQPYRR